VKQAKVLRIYFGFMALAAALFVVAVVLTPDAWTPGYSMGLPRFIVLSLAVGSALTTWGSAVMLAMVHKRAWPLLVMVGLVVCAGLTFAASRVLT
jgi:hypothetical protein